MKNNVGGYKNISLTIILSLILSICLEIYLVLLENSAVFNILTFFTGIETIPAYFSIKQFIVLFILFLIIIYLLLNDKLRIKILSFLYEYRLSIGIVILILGVVFQIHGSSISKIIPSLNSHRALIGLSHVVKSDEYAIMTPFSLSQYHNNFGYFSDIIRSTSTDMFFLQGAPVWDIGVIFRPFHWGYLILPKAYGLSFYWLTRIICLFLISFELGMIITNKNKLLSFAYTLLLTFSPIVQWWIGANSFVEMLIFGQLALVLINYYIKTNNYTRRLICAIGLIICTGGYIFAVYPAWQVPLAYILLCIFIWIVYENRKNLNFDKKDGIIIGLCSIITIVLVVYIFLKSQNAILALSNTIYPGNRVFNGGVDDYWLSGDWRLYFDYMRTIFYPLTSDELGIRISLTYFISFFPLGIGLYIYTTFKQKKRDLLNNLLFVIYVLFTIYFLVTLPPIIGKITLLNKAMTTKFIGIIPLIEMIMLIRTLSIMDKINYPKLLGTFKISFLKGFTRFSFILGFLIAGLVLFVGFMHFGTKLYTKIMLIFALFVFGISFFFILNFNKNNKKAGKGLIICIIFLSVFGGAFVNPIESGVDYYFDNPIISEASNIVQSDSSAIWLIDGTIEGDIVTPVGARTLNSINQYPNLELWSKLDPNNESKDYWNRFAHLEVHLENNEPTSINIPDDGIKKAGRVIVNLNVDELKSLNISYVLSMGNLTQLNTDNVTFELILSDNSLNIYKVKYT